MFVPLLLHVCRCASGVRVPAEPCGTSAHPRVAHMGIPSHMQIRAVMGVKKLFCIAVLHCNSLTVRRCAEGLCQELKARDFWHTLWIWIIRYVSVFIG